SRGCREPDVKNFTQSQVGTEQAGAGSFFWQTCKRWGPNIFGPTSLVLLHPEGGGRADAGSTLLVRRLGVIAGRERCAASSRADADDVRLAPDSGAKADIAGGPRSAKTGCEQSQQGSPYSITSSAVASNDGDTVRPSILAVWALMTSSNLLDCTTGKSAGLAPLRIRPA